MTITEMLMTGGLVAFGAIVLTRLGIVEYQLCVLRAQLCVLRAHEYQHCHQIGEVQHVVAQTATHLRGMTADRLPADVETFVDEMRAYDDDR